MSEPCIAFDGVWKKFRRGEHHDSLRDFIPSLIRRFTGRAKNATALGEQEFWAVRDVSFHAGPGQSLGIIGPNGAGKSTILKLLTRILRPTLGHCHVRGRVGALIEVAAGFHQDLTGRENVYLQGAIMGMKKAEVESKFDQIVEFAGVKDFIETPVKRYSSGMNARLGFSIAAHLDPEVLIIDEVLSVGDSGFQERCVERMRVMLSKGIPLVFVSHNLQAVQELCNQVLVLNSGRAVFCGDPSDGIRHYRDMVRTPVAAQSRGPKPNSSAWLVNVLLFDEGGNVSDFHKTASEMRVRIEFQTVKPLDRLNFAIELYRIDGTYCYGVNTNMDRVYFENVDGRGAVDLSFPSLNLLPGSYSLSVGLLDRDCLGTHDVHHRAYQFTVVSDKKDAGCVYLEHEWRQVNATSAELVRGAHE